MFRYWILLVLALNCFLWTNGQYAAEDVQPDNTHPLYKEFYEILLKDKELKNYVTEFPAFSVIKDPIFKTFQYGYPKGYTVNEACPAGGLKLGNTFLPWHGMVQQVYHDCHKQIHKGLSQIEQADLVHRCFRQTIVRNHNSYPLFAARNPEFQYSKELMKLRDVSRDEMATCANYVYCEHTMHQKKNLNRQVVCPDPCKKDQCSIRDNAMPGSCSSDVHTRMFQNDFMCGCEAGFRWDSATSQCLPKDLCASPKWNPCHRSNTQICQTKDGAVLCLCKTGFGGVTCQLKLD